MCEDGGRESGERDEPADVSCAVHAGGTLPVFVQSLLNRYFKSGLAAHAVCHPMQKRKARRAAGLSLFF